MEWPQIQTTITDGNAISTVVDAPWVSVTSVNGMTGDVIVESVIKPFQSNHYYLKDSVIAYNGSICFAKRTFTSGGSFNANDWDVLDFAQEQADWNENDSTAKSYIKNKPTIPTVNNGTLTIQKNGTNVQTFTANQSTNVTANIVVPTKTSDITNDSGFVTSSGTIAKANQLTTPRTIAISGGATGTATSFNGTTNISIPVTNVKDAYVTWGGKNIGGDITPDDMGCIDEFGHNKLAFLPAECIEIKYSTDGGSTWVDYGASDANKVKMVSTAGPGFYVGGSTNNATASNIANLKLRVRIAAGPTSGGKVYTAAKKILINVSTQGCSGNKVDIKYRTIANYKAGTETWTTVGTYDVAGGSGWNSIPFAYTFGGSFTSQTSQMGQIEFVFYSSGLGTWGLKKLSAIDFRMIGSTNWTMPSEMARAGHLYTVDEGQNATFPANVGVTGSLKHGSYTYTLPNKNGTVAMTSDIPSASMVNDGQLTIQKNATTIGTFTANSATNKTVNIVVPTDTGDLTNNAGYLKASDIYPVGSIVTFYDTVDHSSFLGLTWTRFAAGKMVVGYDSSDTDFDTIGNTGGAKTVTLTVDQIPSHRHSTTSAGSRGKAQADTSGSSGYAWNSDSGGYTGYSGGGQAHNNMPPYITAALWRRVS